MRLPSQRNYADDYQKIQNTVALDENKSRIETEKYPSLDAVRQDFKLQTVLQEREEVQHEE